jgi:type II secretory pathway component PulM
MDVPSMLIGAGIAMLLANVWVWFVLPKWHDHGRRRQQRRTEARLRELSLHRVADRFSQIVQTNGVDQCPTCDPSDASSCSIHGTPSGPTRS